MVNLPPFSNFLIVALVFFYGFAMSHSPRITRQEALKIAKESEEVQAFLSLQIDGWEQCVEKKVDKPCDSGWVTCIEDAWVVKYFLKESCAPRFDERLGVTLLIDAKTGKIISRFPEVMYFEDKAYCLEDYDCLKSASEGICKNFIYTVNEERDKDPASTCQCQESKCAAKTAH